MKDLKNIYTIGYTAFKIEEFISILKKYNITCVIDVRSLAYSQHYTDYNKEAFKQILDSNGIVYRIILMSLVQGKRKSAICLQKDIWILINMLNQIDLNLVIKKY